MYRFRVMLLSALVAGMISGCGEDQPNAPAQPAELNADFAKKTADMMKSANSGMDAAKTKQAPARAAK
jgi:hypothetical protein